MKTVSHVYVFREAYAQQLLWDQNALFLRNPYAINKSKISPAPELSKFDAPIFRTAGQNATAAGTGSLWVGSG